VTRGVIVAPRHRRILELRLRQDQAAAAAVGPNPGHRLRTSRASATDAEYAPKLTEHVERARSAPDRHAVYKTLLCRLSFTGRGLAAW
jgi:hypothetical protein